MPDNTHLPYHRLSITCSEKAPLLINGFVGTESMSSPFAFEIDLLAELPNGDHLKVKPEKLIGQTMTLTVKLGDAERHFSGIISRFWQQKTDFRFAYYRAEIVPWLWLMQLTSNCRVFQFKTVPEILQAVFDDFKGLVNCPVQYADRLKATYTKVDYCLQYRETDFNFVSRLMEREGIFYFFEHDENGHTLVLGDKPDMHKACPGKESARYVPAGGYGEREECVTDWQFFRQLSPGKYTLNDFNFQLDTKDLTATVDSVIKAGGNDKLEIYDYPGRYALRFNKPDERLGDVRKEGDTLVRLRMEEEETPHLEVSGSSIIRAFMAGHYFTLTQHERNEVNGKYLLTSVQHSGSQVPDYVSGKDAEVPYHNNFKCIKYGVPFRPPWITPKPVIHGPQTAIVVGPSGEEIYTDKYGRVKVQFHWDRLGKNNENSSCWARVAQMWAGTRWGSVWIPRIGQEVVVEFLEGDPDHPIVVGCVYNASHRTPYELPDKQTVSTLKSRSSKGGGSSNYNELRFEDNKDKEQVFLQAERDLDVRVKKESREYVGQSRHMIVKQDLKEKIEQNKSVEVKMDQKEKIHMNLSENIGVNHDEKVGMKFAVDSGMEIHLKAGMNCTIEAGAMLTIKVGGNFVNINPAGVFISGTMVMINSGGAAGSGSGASPKDPDPPDEADGGENFDKKSGGGGAPSSGAAPGGSEGGAPAAGATPGSGGGGGGAPSSGAAPGGGGAGAPAAGATPGSGGGGGGAPSSGAAPGGGGAGAPAAGATPGSGGGAPSSGAAPGGGGGGAPTAGATPGSGGGAPSSGAAPGGGGGGAPAAGATPGSGGGGGAPSSGAAPGGGGGGAPAAGATPGSGGGGGAPSSGAAPGGGGGGAPAAGATPGSGGGGGAPSSGAAPGGGGAGAPAAGGAPGGAGAGAPSGPASEDEKPSGGSTPGGG